MPDRAPTQTPRPLLGKFCRCQEGATAVELALIIPPFLLIIFGLIELALIFVMSSNLTNATAYVARQVRVGTIIAPGVGQTSSVGAQLDLPDFKAAICNQISLVPTAACMSQLSVDVRTLSSFQSASPQSPIQNGTFSDKTFCYYSGSPGNIVEIRVYFIWDITTPLLLNMISNVSAANISGNSSSGNYRTISATEVFVNEPNSSTINTGAGC
jgi:Flp pilus assembly protein TadG